MCPPPEDIQNVTLGWSPQLALSSHPSLTLPTPSLPGHRQWWLPKNSTRPACHPPRSSEPETHAPDPKGKSVLFAGRLPQGGAPAAGWQAQQAQPVGTRENRQVSRAARPPVIGLCCAGPGPAGLTCSACAAHRGRTGLRTSSEVSACAHGLCWTCTGCALSGQQQKASHALQGGAPPPTFSQIVEQGWVFLPCPPLSQAPHLPRRTAKSLRVQR